MGCKKHSLTLICLGIIGVMALMATAAQAQQKACVFLKVGAGYAAEMRVVSGSWRTDWSGSFPIGQTKCQDIANLKSGAEYTVEVKAIMGKITGCAPKVPYNPDFKGNITYFAWGTTLSPHCALPTGQEQAEGK